MSDKDKNFHRALHDYGLHGFNSRGIAPSFLGSDSLPQGLADIHWALHGIQGNMDMLDTRMKEFEDNIAEISDDMKDDVIKYIGDKLMSSKTPLTTETGYISKMLTTRTRIFSDSFGPETQMDPRQRIRGFTENYQWISYNQLNPTCEGQYDKIIDFTFVSDHQHNDNTNSKYVTKGKIVLDKCGLLNRVFVTQENTNIVIYYLLTQSVPTTSGVGYTGTIKRVVYDRNSELISDSYVSLNHTPLILLGAFNADVNNEKEFIQYVSTDYKVYQNHNGTDLLIGQLPQDIINLIDPVNDIISDSKQAYIITYNNDGTIKFPLSGFTLLDTMIGNKIVPKFKQVLFENTTNLFKAFVSISPRTQTTLTSKFDESEQFVIEGGYYVELFDSTLSDIPTSHIFLLSSTEEVYDLDRFSSNILDYHSDSPSEFGSKRERDYTEFNTITFYSGLKKIFPEVSTDFGIPDNTKYTIRYNDSKQKETITIYLPEPLVIERDLETRDVNTRLGYTVIHNSDNVKDIADTNILSVYKNLDFINKTPLTRLYLDKMSTYDTSYVTPKYARYRVVEPSIVENSFGVIEVTYFDEYNSVTVTLLASSSNIIGNVKYNENANISNVYSAAHKSSPYVNSQYLAKLHSNDIIYLNNTSNIKDKPYGVDKFTLVNESVGGKLLQKVLVGNSSDVSSNASRHSVIFTRTTSDNYPNEWSGNGTTDTPKHLHTAGVYNSVTGFSTSEIGTSSPNHEVFKNIISNNFVVEVVDSLHTHIEYTITNNIGLVMKYHNIAVRQQRDTNVGSTSKPYTLKYSKWIPGEYVGNDENPYGPDTNAFDKEILRRITNLEAQDIEVQDTPSVNLTKLGDWQDNNPSEVWNPATQSWTVDPNVVTIKADSKLSTGTKQVTTQYGTYTLPNSIVINSDGLFSPDYIQIIKELSNELKETQNYLETIKSELTNTKEVLTETTNALKQIVSSLINSGAWDPNADSTSAAAIELRGGIKPGINIAYGNINLFGGTQDGSSYIRTNFGQTENDLAGGI